MKTETTVKKGMYQKPEMIAAEICTASQSICGWFTQCGKQVKSNK